MSCDRTLTELGHTSDKSNIFTSARNRVSRFDGSSGKYENWRNSIKKYFKSVKAKGDSKVKLVSQFITGRAEDLVDGFLNENPQASWGSLVTFLDKNYSQNRSTQDYLSDLVDLKKLPNEGFEGFEGRIRDLYAKAFPDESEGMPKERRLIRVFRNGIDEGIRSHLLEKRPKTFKEALQMASVKAIKVKKSAPSNDDIHADVKKILEGANLEEVTMRTVIKQVYAKYPDFDLTPRKEFIKSTVKNHLLEEGPETCGEAVQMASEESVIAMTTEYVGSSGDDCQQGPVVREVSAITEKGISLGEGTESNESEGVRKTGRCKWFRAGSGWGFVVPDDHGPDVFVHQSVIKKDGFRSLADGEKVEYFARQTDRGVQATFVCGPAGRNCRGRRRFTSQISQRNVICKNCGEFANGAVKYLPRRPMKACFSGNSNSHPNAGGPPKIVSSDKKYIPGRVGHRP